MSNLFDLDIDLFSSIAETPELFQQTGTTKYFSVGKRVQFEGKINGISVPAAMTLHSARLTRLSLLKQASVNQNGKEYFLVTGIMNPVKMDLEVLVDGEYINLVDLLHNWVNSGSKQITRAEFLDTASKIGLKFTEGMPLFFQQFGASIDGWTKAREAFVAAGAKDVINEIDNPKRIKAAYELKDGVEITGFELGTVKRENSRTNQGFLDLIDASVDQFQRIVRLRKEAAMHEARVLNAVQLGLTQAQVNESKELEKAFRAMSKQWTTNWAGAQQRKNFEPLDQSVTALNQYDPTNAPCGRFEMVVNGEKVSVDLWTNKSKADTPVEVPTSSNPEPF